jgi:hypothetical protein
VKKQQKKNEMEVEEKVEKINRVEQEPGLDNRDVIKEVFMST